MTIRKGRHNGVPFPCMLVRMLLYCTICFICACDDGREGRHKELEKVSDGDPDQLSTDISVKFIDSNFVKALLTAKRGRVYFEKKETWVDTAVKVEFYSRESGSRISVLTCDSARIDDRTRNMYAYGNVMVIADSSRTTLRTVFLEWNNATQKLYSDAFVRISSPSQEIEGYGLESDQKLENYKIFKVTGIKK